jgi:hypothetical protein
MFRARTPVELESCAKVLEFIARSDYQVDPSKWGEDVQIMGGTPHKIGLRFDPQCVRRVAAKIAYGLVRTIAKGKSDSDDDKRIRAYILGAGTILDEPVWITPDPANWSTSSDPHFVLFSPELDRTAAFVNLYGSKFRVQLGDAGTLAIPTAVVCEIDGSGMQIASEVQVANFTALIRDVSFSRPWLQVDSKNGEQGASDLYLAIGQQPNYE